MGGVAPSAAEGEFVPSSSQNNPLALDKAKGAVLCVKGLLSKTKEGVGLLDAANCTDVGRARILRADSSA